MKTNLQTKNNFLPQHLIKKRIYHSRLTYNQNHLANILHFHINKKNKFLKIPTWITNQIFMTMIILLIPEDTPIIDTISAHNQEKTTDFSLVENDIISLSQNPAEIRNTEKST